MQTLFLDIDNTLIYSHRHVLDVPKRAVEFLNGKVQSFIMRQLTPVWLRAEISKSFP